MKAAVLVFMGFVGVWFSRSDFLQQRLEDRSAAALATSQRSVAIIGFQNLSRSSESAWLSMALAEMLGTELSAGARINVIPGEDVARMKIELSLADSVSFGKDTLVRIRNNIGADFVVVGSYIALGETSHGEIRLDVRLQDARDGATVLSGAQVGSEAELFDIVSRTGSELRDKLGVSPVSMKEAGGLAASYSDDAEATRFYSDGLSELRRYRAVEARVLLEKAVENDPSFALAHHALSLAWRTLGYDREAADSARRAFELADGLPREASLMIEARFHENAGNPQEAAASYQLLWAYHQNLDHGLKLAEAQYDADQSSEALRTLAALRRLPAPAGEDPRVDLLEAKARGRVSDYQNQLEAATRAAEKSQAQGAAILLAEARFEEGWSLVRLGSTEGGARGPRNIAPTLRAGGKPCSGDDGRPRATCLDPHAKWRARPRRITLP